ncbi:alpha/beta fold hydrolase [Mycobacterium sp. AZCC_0083]|uniref:alpha/beta fold hydrolase n=1 Tax=Mycobacterium sp. AZCC_0083 TaxID=2735882 RepID=UPI00161E5760|nr:alpha/beta hydrolase [Mycobacterium sp. AZCC_0083]MBB5167598.1 pimeloyl-ACP methyl ester carboxylesterase [Mycobacterium sp. AZCC_0083]
MTTTYRADSAQLHKVPGQLATYGYREFGPHGDIPIVLLQRFRGTVDDWDPKLLELLSDERRVIAVDNVGVGSTDGVAPSSIADMAEGIVDFLAARGLGTVDLIGWSMGGFVAQLLGLDHPELFRRIVIAGSGPGEASIRPEESARSQQIRAKSEPDVDDILYLFFPDTEDGRAQGLETLGRFFHHESGETLTVSEESWQRQGQAIADWNNGHGSAWDRLATFTVPLLVTAGAFDVMEDAAQAFETSRRVGGESTTAIFSNSGHAFLFQYPERFSRLALGFLTQTT